MERYEMTLHVGKVTKNTIVYVPDLVGAPPPLRSLYIEKWATGDPPPERIVVTIEERGA